MARTDRTGVKSFFPGWFDDEGTCSYEAVDVETEAPCVPFSVEAFSKTQRLQKDIEGLEKLDKPELLRRLRIKGFYEPGSID